MLTLLHISDLHFGRARARVLSEAVLHAEASIKPDAVVCSGDLVEWSGTSGPWQEARAFLRRLVSPRLVTPGNHDIERFNLLYRLWRPFGRYHRYVAPQIDSVLDLERAVVVGLGTPRRWSLQLGHLSDGQLALARGAFARAGEGKLRVVTMHHPLLPEPGAFWREHVWGARRILQRLLQIGAQLVLTGHSHFPRAERIEDGQGRALVWAQAGSAGSPRLTAKRCAHNSLNVIRATTSRLVVEWWHYLDEVGRFARAASLAHVLPG